MTVGVRAGGTVLTSRFIQGQETKQLVTTVGWGVRTQTFEPCQLSPLATELTCNDGEKDI